MNRRFKTKTKKYNFKSFKHLNIFFYLLFIITSIFLIRFLLIKSYKSLDTNSINYILSNNNHNYTSKYNAKIIFLNSLDVFMNIDFKKPYSLLINPFYNYTVEKENIISDMVYKDDYDYDNLKNITEHIDDPNSDKVVTNPKIYIYNTHQLENYETLNLEPYNIKPNVLFGSYILKEKLNNLNIPTVVEETDLTTILHANGWNYANSYKASRLLIEDAKKKYPSLEYIIDIHRDSSSRTVTTTNINNKSYAKILFVVGLKNKNYAPNLKLAKDIHEIANSLYPNISRGVLTKEGEGVDGVYNQDLSSNALLIEVGGQANNIDEVNNTMEAISKIIERYLKGG